MNGFGSFESFHFCSVNSHRRNRWKNLTCYIKWRMKESISALKIPVPHIKLCVGSRSRIKLNFWGHLPSKIVYQSLLGAERLVWWGQEDSWLSWVLRFECCNSHSSTYLLNCRSFGEHKLILQLVLSVNRIFLCCPFKDLYICTDRAKLIHLQNYEGNKINWIIWIN